MAIRSLSTQVKRSELAALFLGLSSDLVFCKKNLDRKSNGFWDRAYVKTLCTMAEGMLFALRQVVLASSDGGTLHISAVEKHFLSEITYAISSKRQLEEREMFLKFIPGLRFTIECVSRTLGLERFAASAFSNDGWRAFQDTVILRNRLAHPKHPGELMVKAKELATTRKAECWFLSLIAGIVEPLDKTI